MRANDSDIVISADAHVGEPEGLRRRLPKRYRDLLPVFGVDKDGNLRITVGGKTRTPRRKQLKPTPEDLRREFRTDPSQGTDIDRRLADMAVEGVDAQVIFPNIGLGCSRGVASPGFYHAWARAHNDHVWEVFGPHHHRFKPAAMLAVDDLDAMLEEAKRCLRLGFASFFVPATVPWRPYRSPEYDPLWRLAAEAGVPVNFHIFSGNLAIGGDFAQVSDLDDRRIAKARRFARREFANDVQEMAGLTAVGTAAGMSPIAELTGSGVLERHPRLRFAVIECESGWLAWLLQALDQMQEKRYLNMVPLKLRPSEYFHRQGAVTITDDAVALHNVRFTGTDCLMWGNDYPHDEGTFPYSRRFIGAIRKNLTKRQAGDVLARNAARLYGFDLGWLARHRPGDARRALAA